MTTSPTTSTSSVVRPRCTSTLSITTWKNSGVTSAKSCRKNETTSTSPNSVRYLTRRDEPAEVELARARRRGSPGWRPGSARPSTAPSKSASGSITGRPPCSPAAGSCREPAARPTGEQNPATAPQMGQGRQRTQVQASGLAACVPSPQAEVLGGKKKRLDTRRFRTRPGRSGGAGSPDRRRSDAVGRARSAHETRRRAYCRGASPALLASSPPSVRRTSLVTRRGAVVMGGLTFHASLSIQCTAAKTSMTR